jgi:primosomal protein N'
MSDTPKVVQSLRDQVQACIINADYNLAMQDYEAYERAMQKATALTEIANDIEEV